MYNIFKLKSERGKILKTIGLIAETKNDFERRTPLTPVAVKSIIEKGHKVIVQKSRIRIFDEDEYIAVGAEIREDLKGCDLIFGVKEIPETEIVPGAVHVFFSHTIKAQKYNMPLLQEFLNTDSTIIDYETIVNNKGKRLVFFGKFAGLAGQVDSLHFLGYKLKKLGYKTPLKNIKKSLDYATLADAKEDIKKIGKTLKENPLPEVLGPLTVIVAGYGNVGKGCFEILDCLPVEYIEPDDLKKLKDNYSREKIYVSVLKEEHLVRNTNNEFYLQEYFTKPELYHSIADQYIQYGHMYMNAIYWTDANPVFLSKKLVKEYYDNGIDKPLVVGDITCDIGGSVEFNIKATTPGNPVYTFDPLTDKFKDGPDGNGIIVLAVDTLPCEFPRDASIFFNGLLDSVIDDIIDFDKNNFDAATDIIKNSVICNKGKLAEKYSYLKEHLPE